MNLKRFNKKTLIDFIISVISLSIIFFYLYLRITKKQQIINVTPLEIKTHYNMFLYFFIISCLVLTILLISLWLLNRKNQKATGYLSNFISRYTKIKNNINIFYKGYSIIFEYLSPKYTKYFVIYARNVIAYTKKKTLIIMLLNVMLPRLLIVCVFVVELYIKTLHYYFWFLLLLLIPLCFRFFLFIYSDISNQALPELNKLIDPVTTNIVIETSRGKHVFETLTYRFKPEFEYSENGKKQDLNHFLFNYYTPMLEIKDHMESRIFPLYYKINNLTMLIYTMIQIIGWGYVLFYVV